MPHTSTRVYVDGNYTPPKGVDEKDVAAVTGRSSQDTGQLCGDKIWDSTANDWVRANAIVKWNVWKPVQVSKHGIITYDERKQAHHGFNIDAGSNAGLCAMSIPLLFAHYAANNGEWNYSPSSTHFRLLDFVPVAYDSSNYKYGYHSDAVAPYTINPPSEHTSSISTWTQQFILNSRQAAEIPLSEILEYNTYQSTLSNLKYALAVKYEKNGSTYYIVQKAQTMEATPSECSVTQFTNGMSLECNIALDGYRVYECMWCVIDDANFNPSDLTGFCAYIHNAKFNFELKQQTDLVRYTHTWSSSGISLTTMTALDYKGESVQCAAINFSSAILSLLTTYDNMPESRTLKLISTPIITYDGGDLYVGEPIVHSSNINVAYGQQLSGYQVDTSLLGTVLLLDANNAGWKASRVSQVEVITQLDFADTGAHSIALNPYSGTEHIDILTF